MISTKKITIAIIITVFVLILVIGYIVSANKPGSTKNPYLVTTGIPTNSGNTATPNNLSDIIPSVTPTPDSTSEMGVSPSPSLPPGELVTYNAGGTTYNIGERVDITKTLEPADVNFPYFNNLTMTLYRIIPNATTGYIVALAPGDNVGLVKVDNTLTAPNAYDYGPDPGPFYQFDNVSSGSAYTIEVEWDGYGWYVYPSPFEQETYSWAQVSLQNGFALNNTSSTA